MLPNYEVFGVHYPVLFSDNPYQVAHWANRSSEVITASCNTCRLSTSSFTARLKPGEHSGRSPAVSVSLSAGVLACSFIRAEEQRWRKTSGLHIRMHSITDYSLERGRRTWWRMCKKGEGRARRAKKSRNVTLGIPNSPLIQVPTETLLQAFAEAFIPP